MMINVVASLHAPVSIAKKKEPHTLQFTFIKYTFTITLLSET